MLSDDEYALLRALFEEAYSAPKMLNARYRSAELQDRARAIKHRAEEASIIVNGLIEKRMLSRSRSSSGLYTEYTMTRAAINFLAARNLKINKVGFSFSEDEQRKLIGLLTEVERALPSADGTNVEQAMAHAYIISARVLAEAPDPPSDLIWELVNRASQIAGIASLFVAIFALFAASGK